MIADLKPYESYKGSVLPTPSGCPKEWGHIS